MFEDEIRNLGGIIYRIPHVNNVGPIKYSKNLNSFFKEHKEHKIIHSHMNAMTGIILREARKVGKPIRISHSHSSFPKMGKIEGLFKNYSKLFVNKNANYKFACSEIAGRWLYGNKEQDKNITIVKNGVDIDKFRYNSNTRDNKRIELGISDESLVIGHIGSFKMEKNHEFLIDIFSNIKKIHPNTVLILVGDGNLRKFIENKIEGLSLENNVKLLGIRSDVNELIQSFDCIVFPSLYEGLPVTLVEAQASGLKCIISDSITKEVDMGLGLVDFIDLNKGSKYWAEHILSIDKNYKRNDSELVIKEKGYSIVDTTKWLTKFYLTEYNNKVEKEK